MTKIIYKRGNLLMCDEPAIMHGCNAQGVMGSGVAKQLRDADEGIFTAYRRTYEDQGNKLDVGQSIWVFSKPLKRTVINAVTQEFYGRDPNRVYVSYDAIMKVMRGVSANVKVRTEIDSARRVLGEAPDAVAMPLIGAGLANGSWPIISKIIEEAAEGWQPVVYIRNEDPLPVGVALNDIEG